MRHGLMTPRNFSAFLARCASALVILLGLLVMIGWWVNSALLTSTIPGLPVMKFNAALCFVLIGVALVLENFSAASRYQRFAMRAGQVVAIAVIAISGSTLAENLFHLDFGIDQYFVREASGDIHPGRMVLLTALAFLFLGISVALKGAQLLAGHRASQVGAIAANLLGFWGVLDIVLDPFRSYTGIAAHTAFGLWLFSFGVLASGSEKGFLDILGSDTTGGHVARRLVPAAIGIPLLVGVVRWNSLLVSAEIRTSVLILVCTALLVTVALWTSSGLDRLDRARRITEARFRGLLESAPDPIIVVDSRGIMVVVNGQTEKLFGYQRDELLGHPIGMLLPERLSAAHAKHVRDFFEAPAVRSMGQAGDLVARRRDGSEFPAEISLGPFDGDEGILVSCAIRDITDRLGLQESLRSHQRRLALAMKAGRSGTFDWEIQTNVNHWSGESEELYGLEPGSFRGTYESWEELLLPEDLEEARAAVSESLRTGSLAAEWRIRRRSDGQVRWISTQAQVFFDDAGRPQQMTGINIDVTEQKASEDQLRETQQRLAMALSAGQMGVWDLDMRTGVCWRTFEHDRIFGYDELLPQWEFTRFQRHVHPDDRAATEQAFSDAYRTGHLQIECRIICVNQAVRWIRIDGDVVYDEHRTPMRMKGVIHDITERKLADEELRAAEERYRLLVDGVKDYGIFMLDSDGRISTWNEGAQRQKGYNASEVLGRDSSIFYPKEERAARWDLHLLETAIREGSVRDEGWRERKDGSRIWAEVVITALRDQHGNLLGYSNCSRDLTERKKIEDDLRRSNAELQQFAYVASHDLQEPLRMVASFTQLLAQRYQGKLDKDADEFIGYAVDGARRMQHLIDDLLAYSRVGTRAKDPKICSADDLLQAALRQLTVAIEESGAVVRASHLPRILGDDLQITSVFQNLIGNAIKFRAPNVPPLVEIAATQSGAEWIFSVKDNGIGIEPRHFERVFQVFQRLQTRESYPGNGIGLAICRKIVERHGGRIWLESQPGRGTTFFFTIPCLTGSQLEEVAHDVAYTGAVS